MKNYLIIFLLIFNYSLADSNIEPTIVPDLAYEDNEDLYLKVFGHVDHQEDMLFNTEVFVDGEKAGTAPTIIGKHCKIQAVSLKNCLFAYLDSDDIDIIDKYKDADGFVDFQELNKLSLSIRLNQLTMSVEVNLPIDKKKARNFSGRHSSKKDISNVKPANLSAIVNMRASQSFHRTKSSSSGRYHFILTPYINLLGLCLEGEASLEKDSREKRKLKRNYTTLVYDWANRDIMFKFGDIFSNSLSYQNPPHVWGFNINKDVLRETTSGNSCPIQITVLRTSTIEIYSNKQLIRSRTNVAPGTYILDDVSFQNGFNDVKIKIIDETGHEEILDESFFYTSSFVPKGKFIFSGTYGYPETNNKIKGRYDKNNPLISLFLKYGLFASLELGIGLLKTKTGKTLSYELRNNNKLGQFVFKFANSNYKNKPIDGKVFYAMYSSPSIPLFNKTNFSCSASIEKSDRFFKPYLSEQTSTISFNDIVQKEEFINGKSTVISYKANLNNLWSYNTGIGYSTKKTFNKKKAKNFYCNISRGFNINNNWFSSGNISASFSKYTNSENKRSKSFSLFCSLSLKNHIDLSSGCSKTDDKSNQYLTMYYSPEQSRWNGDISVNRSGNVKGMNVHANYSSNIVQSHFSHSKNSSGARSTNIGISSAFFFADGRFAISRCNYSDGGFVLVTPQKDLKNHKIKFLGKNSESYLPGGSIVLNNSRISQTLSRIDLKDIPDDIYLNQDTVISQGEYKRGFIADIQGTKSFITKGILVDSQGEILKKVTGFAINKDNPELPPISFFTNESGEFSLFEITPGNYTLSINIINSAPIELEIIGSNQNQEDSILDLGTVVCQDLKPTSNLKLKTKDGENYENI